MNSLLEFARGPALQLSLGIFVLGVAWRLFALFLLPWRRNRAKPRAGNPGVVGGALRGMVSHWFPRREYMRRSAFHFVNGYVFHIGFLVILLGFGPHISFFSGLFGLSWPDLPTPFIYLVGAITLASLLAALVHRISNPVQRLISSFDDYFSWFVTMLPVLTGLAIAGHFMAHYRVLLAIHILSVCLLLIWLPFGKLMHTFLFLLSRATTGARLAMRGVKF